MKKLISFLVAAALSGTIFGLGAADAAGPRRETPVAMPYYFHGEQNIDRRQVGYVDVVVAASGSVTSKWSNGQQIRGNNFYSVVYLVRSDGTHIRAILQQKGLDGSGGGRAREGAEHNTFTMAPNELLEFDHIEFKMGVTNCGIELFEMTDLVEWKFRDVACSTPKEVPTRKHQFMPTPSSAL